MAFKFAWDATGADPIIQKITVADGEILSIGELVNLESGEADAAATGDTALLGACVEAVDNTDDGLTVKVVTNPYAVYEVADANARLMGATLDIAAGGLTVGASSNADLIVVRSSSATEPTYVTFNQTHYLT